MSWGPCFLYYTCPECGKKFKYATDMIPVFGADFGNCPECGTEGKVLKEGARTPDDMDFEEVSD